MLGKLFFGVKWRSGEGDRELDEDEGETSVTVRVNRRWG